MFTVVGFDEAIIGTVLIDGENITAYDRELCVKLLIRDQGMTHEDAEEYFSFNVEGAYMGKGTPIFINVKEETPGRILPPNREQLINICEEIIGGADNQGPINYSTLEKLIYAVEAMKQEPKGTASTH